jgi:NADH-quinone oxidoreductase subunit L
MTMTTAAWVCIFSPMIGAALTPALARLHPTARDLGAVLFSFLAAIAALTLLPGLLHPELLPLEHQVTWLTSPLQIGFGILVDPLSIVLTNVVAVISFIIMVYCLGYMKGDPAQTRFWMWMNGFIGSMLLLVLSNNLLFLFIGWKLVGVCSYGLIGFYYQDQRKYWIGGPSPTAFVTPSQACIKALVVTGVGDMLMLGGILLVYFYSGTLNFLELYETAPTWLSEMAADPGMIILVSVLLLAGPIGKSAQFPFHEWLPEAMAGPGPVSALIHAATMVKSGVYLVARLVPIFYYGRWVGGIDEAAWFFYITAWVGAFTAFLAATQGMVALELKKVLAYSTVSQIGYMLLGLGAAGFAPSLLLDGYTSGVFHLVSHALFKACLFLCAGTVIHAVHSIYIQEMGGVRKHLPWTWFFTLVAALSLIGLPPFPGFWSKDAVLLITLEASTPLFLLALITVTITAFYTIRFLGMVFYGPESKHLQQADHSDDHGHLHDGAMSMRVASGVLAVAIIIAGLGGPLLAGLLHHGFDTNLAEGIAGVSEAMATDAGHESTSHTLVPLLSVLFLLIGAVPAFYLYILRKTSPAALIGRYSNLRSLHSFLWNRWFIDGFYNRVFITGTSRAAKFVAEDLEAPLNDLVHRSLPWLFTVKAERIVHHLRTDTEELLYNVSYVLILFVMLVTYLFLGTGGGL